jgi:ferredoxin-NADP reductase
MQTTRGNRPYLLLKVEYIAPVMAVYFRPVFKEDFQFKEGEYLYLNCPAISHSEWHPFTISSATDDLYLNNTRIHLETGTTITLLCDFSVFWLAFGSHSLNFDDCC